MLFLAGCVLGRHADKAANEPFALLAIEILSLDYLSTRQSSQQSQDSLPSMLQTPLPGRSAWANSAFTSPSSVPSTPLDVRKTPTVKGKERQEVSMEISGYLGLDTDGNTLQSPDLDRSLSPTPRPSRSSKPLPANKKRRLSLSANALPIAAAPAVVARASDRLRRPSIAARDVAAAAAAAASAQLQQSFVDNRSSTTYSSS